MFQTKFSRAYLNDEVSLPEVGVDVVPHGNTVVLGSTERRVSAVTAVTTVRRERVEGLDSRKGSSRFYQLRVLRCLHCSYGAVAATWIGQRHPYVGALRMGMKALLCSTTPQQGRKCQEYIRVSNDETFVGKYTRHDRSWINSKCFWRCSPSCCTWLQRVTVSGSRGSIRPPRLRSRPRNSPLLVRYLFSRTVSCYDQAFGSGASSLSIPCLSIPL